MVSDAQSSARRHRAARHDPLRTLCQFETLRDGCARRQRDGGTFAFPAGLTPNIPAGKYAADPRAQHIASAATRLNELRENWLNPPELVDRVPEVVPRYPDRLVPKNAAAAADIKKRTLTNLYNGNPAWLQHAHRVLDKAVAAPYGWEWPLADEEILKRLFELNQKRAGKGRSAG